MRLPAAARRDVELCSYCPKLCRDVCPVACAEHNERLTPAEKGATAMAVTAGRIPLDAEAASTFYACTGCAASAPACKHRIDASAGMEAARALAVASGAEPPRARAVADRIRAHGAPYRRDLAAIVRERIGEGNPARAATVLFAGCDVVARTPEVLDAGLALAAACGTGHPDALGVYVGSPFCCGYPLAVLGYHDLFVDHIRRVGNALSGAERVLTLSPACAEALGPRAAHAGAPLGARVAPLVSFLGAHADGLAGTLDPERALAALAPAESAAGVFYHDACTLGRRLGVYEAPRKLLGAALGAPPAELIRNRDAGGCAGGGSGYEAVSPDGAARIAAQRIDEARTQGAGAIVTGCPTARRLLADAAATGGPPLPVGDLIAVAAAGLEPQA